jgi:hypothetical protein
LTRQLAALALLFIASTAQARTGEVMLAARVGAFVPQPFSPLGSSYLVGVEAGWVAPVWKRRLAVAVDLAFSAPDGEGRFQSGAAVAPIVWRAALREVTIGLSLMVRQPFGRFVPYLALGPRLLVVDALVASHAGGARLPTNRESTLALGLSLVPGLGFSLGPGQLFLEVPCAFLWRVGAAPRLTGDFDPSALTLAAGYRVFF